jgi:hypothetical protein
MYPADKLDVEGGYTSDDLPDAITLHDANGALVGSIPKSGDHFEGSDWKVFVEDGEWQTQKGSESIYSVGGCLITGDGNYTPGNDMVEDQFAAEYYIVEPIPILVDQGCVGGTAGDMGPSDANCGSMYRLDLCNWFGDQLITYAGAANQVRWNSSLCKWQLLVGALTGGFDPPYGICELNVIFTKTGTQKSPVGTYIDPVKTGTGTITTSVTSLTIAAVP